MKRILAFLFLLLPMLASAQDIGGFTEVSNIPENSWFLVQTNHVVGLRFTRKINSSNLVANLSTFSTWPSALTFGATNITTTNATTFGVFWKKSGNTLQFLDLAQGSNIVMYRDPVTSNIVINATGTGSGGALVTNQFQFAPISTLTLISGARMTNGNFQGVSTNAEIAMRKEGGAGNYGTINFYDDLGAVSGTFFGSTGLSPVGGGLTKGMVITANSGNVLLLNAVTDMNGQSLYSSGSNFFGAIKLINGQPSGSLAIIDGNTNIVGWIATNIFGNLIGATNGLHNSKLANSGGLGTNETFRGVTLPSLTASRVTFVDANGNLTNVTSASPSTEFVKADGTVAVPSGAGDVTTAQLNSASNVLRTDLSNLQGATNGLTTRATNLEGATNGLTTRATNLEGATNGLNTGVNGLLSRALTNTDTRVIQLNTNVSVNGTNISRWVRLDGGQTNSSAVYLDSNTNLVGHPSVTAAELSQIDGVTGNVQTNLDARIASQGGKGTNNSFFNNIQIGDGDSTGQTTISNQVLAKATITLNGNLSLQNGSETANRVLYLNGGKNMATLSTVDSTELGFLDGVTSALQTQIDGKIAGISTLTNDVLVRGGSTNINLIAGPSLVIKATNNAANNRTDYWIDAPASALADGDKTDITVSSSGSVWTIDNDAVTFGKIENLAGFSVFGKATTGTGDGGNITAGTDTVLGRNGSGNLGFAQTATGQIADNAVTNPKLADMATARIKARISGGTGDPEDATLTQVLDLVGTAAQGDVLYRGAATWDRLAAGTSGQVLQSGGVGANPSWTAPGVGTTNAPVIGVGTLYTSNAIQFQGSGMFLRTTNLWADGGVSSIYSNMIAANIGGLTNIYITNLLDGQTLNLWFWVSNGASVGFPQFAASDYTDGAAVSPNTNCWTRASISRRANLTNIQIYTATMELLATNGIQFQTNYASRRIYVAASTNIPGQILTNQIRYIAAEYNGSNGTSAVALTNNWDMSLNTFKSITNSVGTNLTFTLSNIVAGQTLITTFKGVGGYSNRVVFSATSGVNIRWMNIVTNGNFDILSRPNNNYRVDFFANSATNINATVQSDDATILAGLIANASLLNTTTLLPGSGFSNAMATIANGTTLQLADGIYTVPTSKLTAKILGSTPFLGATLANKTNVTILGIPGQTIIDGSTAPGEQLLITNCFNIKIVGVTFSGYTNHNFTQLPSFAASNGITNLWSGVIIANCGRVTVENCQVIQQFDQGLIDGASFFAAVQPSTNQILINACSFEDIGGWYTNNPTSNFKSDGCALGPTGWTVINCDFKNCLRAIETFTDATVNNTPYLNLIIQNCRAKNVVEWFVSPAGSTNCGYALVQGNSAINDASFTYHGTNFSVGNTPSPSLAFFINGGRGWQIVNNQARGNMLGGFYFANTASFLDDCAVTGNFAIDINNNGIVGAGFQIGDPGSDTAAYASAVRRLTFRDNRAINCVSPGFAIYSGRDITFEGNYGYRPSLLTSFSDGQGGRLSGGSRIGVNGYTVNKLTNLVMRNNTLIDGGVSSTFGWCFESSCQSVVNENNQSFGFVGGDTNTIGAAIATMGIPRSFSADIDFPSVGVASQFTTNFTATGVTTNDTVTLYYSPAFWASGTATNVVLTSWPSNNLVYIRMINNDAVTAANPPQTRFTATVRQSFIAGQP